MIGGGWAGHGGASALQPASPAGCKPGRRRARTSSRGRSGTLAGGGSLDAGHLGTFSVSGVGGRGTSGYGTRHQVPGCPVQALGAAGTSHLGRVVSGCDAVAAAAGCEATSSGWVLRPRCGPGRPPALRYDALSRACLQAPGRGARSAPGCHAGLSPSLVVVCRPAHLRLAVFVGRQAG